MTNRSFNLDAVGRDSLVHFSLKTDQLNPVNQISQLKDNNYNKNVHLSILNCLEIRP